MGDSFSGRTKGKMATEKSVKITTKRQFEVMINFMIKNPMIAKGMKIADSFGYRDEFGKKWDGLSVQLNSLGPPIRDVAAWQKVWSDYKLKLKKKIAHNKNEEINSIDGSSYKLVQFTSMEEQMISLLCLQRAAPLDNALFGIGDITQQVFNFEDQQQQQKQEQHDDEEEVEEEEEEEPEQNKQESTCRSKRRHQQQDYEELLIKQTACLSQIPELLVQANKYLKRISDTVEKKVKLDDNLQKKQKTEVDLKLEILALEKRKLELEIQQIKARIS